MFYVNIEKINSKSKKTLLPRADSSPTLAKLRGESRGFSRVSKIGFVEIGVNKKHPLESLSILRGVSCDEALYLEMAYQFFQIIREARK